MTTTDSTRKQADRRPHEPAKVLELETFRRQLRDTSGSHRLEEEAQLKEELMLAFSDLGGATFALAHQGTFSDKRLAPRVQRIEDLYARLAQLENVGQDRLRQAVS
jgi:hypothetical protein